MFPTSPVLFCKCRSLTQIKRYSHKSRVQILSDMLGLSEWQAKHVIARNKLKISGEQLTNSIQFCQSLYSNEEIIKTPKLIGRNPLLLEQHYLAMEEGAFHPIGPEVLSRSIYYMRRSVKDLKAENRIPKEANVVKSLTNYIQDRDLAERLFKEYNEGAIWNQIHLSILQEFLKYRLNATDDEIIRLFRIHKMIKNKSFRVIQENIALAEDLGFKPRKILKCGYLLNTYPKYTKRTLNELSDLAGANMRKAMKDYPKLFMTPTSNIIKIYGILKTHEIPDKIIRSTMNIFHMGPETVLNRLHVIENNPDLRPLLRHSQILKLIVHHNRARSRLSFLQQLQLKCASAVILAAGQDKSFENYIREGKDVNRDLDVKSFLQKNFKVDSTELVKKLKKHPFYLHVPLRNMQDTYDYLIRSKIYGLDIFKVIFILLYPKEKIKDAVNKLKMEKQRGFRFQDLSKTDKLNMILYVIEKEHHFTGNGIWENRAVHVPEETLE